MLVVCRPVPGVQIVRIAGGTVGRPGRSVKLVMPVMYAWSG